MSLFNFKKKYPVSENKKTDKKESGVKQNYPKKTGLSDSKFAPKVISGVRVTEKASDLGTLNVHVFNVTPEANKKSVAKTFFSLYKVMPKKVRIVKIMRKRVFNRGRWGYKSGGKKAYIYLNKGEKIDTAL